MLYNIIRNQSPLVQGVAIEVVSLGVLHYYEEMIVDCGVPVHDVKYKSGRFQALMHARRYCSDADVVCCWLYGANILGWLVTIGLRSRLIWNVRHADLSRAGNRLSVRLAARLGAVLSRFSRRVSVIAYNGYRSRALHESIGYPKGKAVVLDNGLDLVRFKPVSATSLRESLGLEADQKVVLSVARWDPIKDHENFLRAFLIVREEFPESVAVMCGGGIDAENDVLVGLIRGLGLSGSVLLLGARGDVAALYSLADVYVLHSLGEAFPNTLLEAMGSGCMVVSTDVGDVVRILPPGRSVVPPRDPASLARAIVHELSRSTDNASAIAASGREFVSQRYGIAEIVRRYEAVLLDRVDG